MVFIMKKGEWEIHYQLEEDGFMHGHWYRKIKNVSKNGEDRV